MEREQLKDATRDIRGIKPTRTSSIWFAREVWYRLFSRFGLLNLTPRPTDRVYKWCSALVSTGKEKRKGFNSLVILGAWVLWDQQNNILFNNSSPSVQHLLQVVDNEVHLWSLTSAKGPWKPLVQVRPGFSKILKRRDVIYKLQGQM